MFLHAECVFWVTSVVKSSSSGLHSRWQHRAPECAIAGTIEVQLRSAWCLCLRGGMARSANVQPNSCTVPATRHCCWCACSGSGELHSQLAENRELLAERGQKLERLQDRTAELESGAEVRSDATPLTVMRLMRTSHRSKVRV